MANNNTNLFSSLCSMVGTSGIYNITTNITLLPDNTVELIFKGTPQFIAYSTYFTTEPTYARVAQIDATGICTVNLNSYNLAYTYKNFYFIYALSTLHLANAVQKIIPSTKHANLEFSCKSGTFIIHIPSILETRVVNYGDITKIIGDQGKFQQLKPNEFAIINPSSSTTSITIRDSDALKTYLDLSKSEYEQYIPEDVFTGRQDMMCAINSSTMTTWIDFKLCLYQGTLTYIETKDKFIHMITDNGCDYLYNIELFRTMIPLLVKGVISGTFRFAPKKDRNIISYVLIPYNTSTDKKTKDLFLCDSDSSDD